MSYCTWNLNMVHISTWRSNIVLIWENKDDNLNDLKNAIVCSIMFFLTY